MLQTFIVRIREARQDNTITQYIVDASHQQEVLDQFSSRGEILSLTKEPSFFDRLKESLFEKPATTEEIFSFLQFLAHALKRGVAIQKTLEFLKISEDSKPLQRLIGQLLSDLEKPFSSYYDVFRKYPDYFDHGFLGVVRAGESSGNLAENILEYIQDSKKMQERKREILGVFLKRTGLLSVVLGVASVIVLYVIPQFAKIFQKPEDIPLALKNMLFFSDILLSYGPYVLGGGVIAIALLVFGVRSSYIIRKKWDMFVCDIPIVGELIKIYYTTLYVYSTGSLLKKNVHYIKILDILIDRTKNLIFKEIFEILRDNTIAGVSLSAMLKEDNSHKGTKVPQGYLLASLPQAIEMGSATGNMGDILYDAYVSYDTLLHQRISRAIIIFDRVFYGVIVSIMFILFYTMGTALSSLYMSAGKLSG